MSLYKTIFKGCYEYAQVEAKADTTEEIEFYYNSDEGKLFSGVLSDIEKFGVEDIDEDTSIITLFVTRKSIEGFKFDFSNYNKNKVTEIFLQKIDEENDGFNIDNIKENDIVLIEYETRKVNDTDFYELIDRIGGSKGNFNKVLGKRIRILPFGSKLPSTIGEELSTHIDFDKNYASFETEKFDVLIGVCKIKSIVNSYNVFQDEIFARNVRVGLNDKRLSSSIIRSIIESPIDFSLHHNGIVIYSKSRKVNTSFSSVVLKDFSVVNGAQTLSTLGSFYDALTSKKDSKILNKYDFKEEGFYFTFALKITDCDKIIEKDISINLLEEEGEINRSLLKLKIPEKLDSMLTLAEDKYNDYYFSYAEKRLKELYEKIEGNYKINYDCIEKYVDERISKATIVTKIFSNKKGYNEAFDVMAEEDVSKVSFSSNNQVAIGAKDKYINHDIVSAINNEYIKIKKSGEQKTEYKDVYIFSLSEVFSIIKSVADNKPGKARAQKKDDLIEEYVMDNFIIRDFINLNEDNEYEISENTTRSLMLYKICDKVRVAISKSDFAVLGSSESKIIKYGKYHLFNYVYNNIEDWEEIDNITKLKDSIVFTKKASSSSDIEYCNEHFNTVKVLIEGGINTLKDFIEHNESLDYDSNSFKKDFCYDVERNEWIYSNNIND